MKNVISLWVFLLIASSGFAQVKIHSHNDYEQQEKFKLAYQNQVYEIEVDVFEVNGALMVAHSKKEIRPGNTLKTLYLDQIDSLFKLYQGRVSKDSKYAFSLMIDFKTPWSSTFVALEKQLENYRDLFNRSANKNAVQIVVSGNRPVDSTFHTYPDWAYFDGLPNVKYKKADLKRIAMISDNFKNYSNWTGVGEIPKVDQIKLLQTIEAAHQLKKPIRFWGAPDTPDSWKQLCQLGADIINTDKIVACKTFLSDIK